MSQSGSQSNTIEAQQGKSFAAYRGEPTTQRRVNQQPMFQNNRQRTDLNRPQTASTNISVLSNDIWDTNNPHNSLDHSMCSNGSVLSDDNSVAQLVLQARQNPVMDSGSKNANVRGDAKVQHKDTVRQKQIILEKGWDPHTNKVTNSKEIAARRQQVLKQR